MNEIRVSTTRLAQLEKAEKKLQALEAGGVDNWEWYSESLKDFFVEEEREELLDKILENTIQVFCEEGEVNYPAGREAGHSISLSRESEQFLRRVLKSLIDDYVEGL